MVRIGQQMRVRILCRHMLHYIFRLRYSAQNQRITSLFQRHIFLRCEMQLLERWQVQTVVHNAHLDGLKVLRTLGYDDGFRLEGTRRQVAKCAPRQHMVVYVQIVICREQYREAATESTVLHCVVQHDDVKPGRLFLQLSHSAYTVLADCHRHVGKSTVQLHRLVANRFHRGLRIRHDEPFGLALVTAGQHRRMVAVRSQQLHYISRHGRLARAPDGEVTHADGGNPGVCGREQMAVVQLVAHCHTERVEPTHRYE